MKDETEPSIFSSFPEDVGGVTARQGFKFQDHVAVWFCLEMLQEASDLIEVWCEAFDDIVLLWNEDGTELIEFVQVKSKSLDQLWTVANLCAGGEDSLFVRSLKQASSSEEYRFRIVTTRPVKNELKPLTIPLRSADRARNGDKIIKLKAALRKRFPTLRSANGASTDDWVDRAIWNVRDNQEALENRNLRMLDEFAEMSRYKLLASQRQSIYEALVAKARVASEAKWTNDGAAKKIGRDSLRTWLLEQFDREADGESPNRQTHVRPSLDELRKHLAALSRMVLEREVPEEKWLDRPEFEELQDFLLDAESQALCLLGSPGAGKSALLARFCTKAGSLGFEILAIRADRLPSQEPLMDWLSKQLHTGCSPLAEVERLALRGQLLVVVDQLDSVADLVDLKTERLNEILSFIIACSSVPEIKILCACRTFEFNHDTRIQVLDAKQLVLELPQWEKIAERLNQEGVPRPERLPPEVREMLRTPQILQIYVDLWKSTNTLAEFGSYQELLDEFWNRNVSDQAERDVLYRFAEISSKNESLSVAESRFEEYRPAILSLISKGILIKNGASLEFQHQTLLEHAKARLFVRNEISLAEHVRERQDAIFVRPTIWAVLTYLRTANFPKYIHEIEAMLSDENLRLHVRYLLIDILGQVEAPDQGEAVILINELQRSEDRKRILIAIRGKELWFQAISRSHLPSIMRWPQHDLWTVVSLIQSSWDFDRDYLIQLMREYWLDEPATRTLIYYAISDLQNWDIEAISLIRTVIEIGLKNSDEMWWTESIVDKIAADHPEEATKLFLTIVAYPLQDSDQPAARALSEKMLSRKHTFENETTWYRLPQIAKSIPNEFLALIWPLFAELVENFYDSAEQRVLYEYRGYLAVIEDSHDRHLPPILKAIIEAAELSAVSAPEKFIEITRPSWALPLVGIHRILIRAMLAAPEQLANHIVHYLCEDRRRLAVGEVPGVRVDYSRRLISAVSSYLSDPQLTSLKNAILGFSMYRTDIELCEDQQIWDREARLRLLVALPADRLDDETRQSIASEKHALPSWDREPRRTRWARVKEIPPTTVDELLNTSPDELLEHLELPEEYSGEFSEWNAEVEHWERPGGAATVRAQLVEIGKHHREKAFELLSAVLKHDQELAASSLITGLCDGVLSAKQAFEIIRDVAAHRPKSDELRSSCATLLNAVRTNQIPLDICQIFENWLSMPWNDTAIFTIDNDIKKPEKEPNASLLWHSFGTSYNANGPFPVIYMLAVGYLIQDRSSHSRLLNTFTGLISNGFSNETWMSLCHPLASLKLTSSESESVQRFFVSLTQTYPEICTTSDGFHLIAKWSYLLSDGLLQSLLADLRAISTPTSLQGYGELLTYIAVKSPEHPWALTALEVELRAIETEPLQHEFMAMGIAYTAGRLWEHHQYRTLLNSLFARLVEIATERIGGALGTIFWLSTDFPADSQTHELLEAVSQNPAIFSGRFVSDLIELLAKLLPYERQLVAIICEKIIDRRGEGISPFTDELIFAAPQLVNISMTLQRHSDSRAAGLNLLESLLRLGLDEAFKVLDENDLRTEMKSDQHLRKRRKRSSSASRAT